MSSQGGSRIRVELTILRYEVKTAGSGNDLNMSDPTLHKTLEQRPCFFPFFAFFFFFFFFSFRTRRHGRKTPLSLGAGNESLVLA